MINRYSQGYQDRANELYQKTFGEEPHGQVGLRANPWVLAFEVDKFNIEDRFIKDQASYVNAIYYSPSNEKVKIDELRGKVIKINKEDRKDFRRLFNIKNTYNSRNL